MENRHPEVFRRAPTLSPHTEQNIMDILSVITLWIIGTVVVSILAEKRGRSGAGWSLLAFFILSPLVCGILLLVLPRKKLSEHDQLLFDAMTVEQQERVLAARELRRAGLHPKPAVTGTGEWRHQD
jgi:hypothetical protein